MAEYDIEKNKLIFKNAKGKIISVPFSANASEDFFLQVLSHIMVTKFNCFIKKVNADQFNCLRFFNPYKGSHGCLQDKWGHKCQMQIRARNFEDLLVLMHRIGFDVKLIYDGEEYEKDIFHKVWSITAL